MHVAVVRDHNTVTIDGKTHAVDCSSLNSAVRVIQWLGESGWIEFNNDLGVGAFIPNEPIPSIDVVQPFIDAWMVEDAKPVPESVVNNQYNQELEMMNAANIRSDFDREMFVSLLRSLGPEAIKTHVNQNVNDLDDVKQYLTQLTLLVAGVIRK